jgi:hypothetical protein
VKICLIQTGAIGDIVIALPIAYWFYKRGCDVFWPVDSDFVAFLTYAAPYVNFLPIDKIKFPKGSYNYFVGAPLAYANQIEPSKTFTLYSHLSGLQLEHRAFANSLKFDEYKYAVCDVPFSEKWNLQIRRNTAQEALIANQLPQKHSYCLLHEQGGEGSNFVKAIAHLYPEAEFGTQVRISNLTSSPFDWLLAFENAYALAFIDSLHANLAEQLNLTTRKYLHLRSPVNFTPVFKNGWTVRP